MPAPTKLPTCLRSVSQVLPQAVTWLWPGRLALGKLAMLEGDPGLGKSLVTLDLCARLSTGRDLPDGGRCTGPANSLILNGEDAAGDTIRPRLQALGADLERVFVLQRGDDHAGMPLRFPSDSAELEQAVIQTAARLVVIDPFMAFLEPGILIGDDPSVRRVLLPLAKLAQRQQCAIRLVRHLTKTGAVRSVYRGGGSMGLFAACRSGWLIAKDPCQPERRVLATGKNNLAPPQPSLAFELVPQPDGPPTLSWLGPCDWTADALLAPPGRRTSDVGPGDRAADFLAALLANGPRTVREIWELAKEERFSSRTLQRARQELNIRSVRVRVDGRYLSYWLLPDQQLPDSVPPEARPLDLEAWLAPLREKYPPPTPLEEDL